MLEGLRDSYQNHKGEESSKAKLKKDTDLTNDGKQRSKKISNKAEEEEVLQGLEQLSETNNQNGQSEDEEFFVEEELEEDSEEEDSKDKKKKKKRRKKIHRKVMKVNSAIIGFTSKRI